MSSHQQDASVGDDELRPTQTQGYKVGEKKTLEEYSQLDANDESLQRWKASLGIADGAGAGGDKPKVRVREEERAPLTAMMSWRESSGTLPELIRGSQILRSEQ